MAGEKSASNKSSDTFLAVDGKNCHMESVWRIIRSR